MNDEKRTNDYYAYLLGLIDADYVYERGYILLMRKLFHTQFYWVVRNDENRAADGLALRAHYADWCGEKLYFLDGKCTVLEMMVALARRMETDILFNYGDGDNTPTWFWMMIENLGLKKFTDDCFDDDEIDYILENWMSRNRVNGQKLSLFFLPDNLPDNVLIPDNLEIWYQMQDFVINHFDF